MSALAQQDTSGATIERGQDAVVISFRVIGWLATTVMATLGFATLFFFVLGGFTLSGTMIQLDNLASRYVAADAARLAQFHTILCAALAVVFALIAFFRRASLRSAFSVNGVNHD